MKCPARGSFVVGGLLAERRRGSQIGSLAVGAYDDVGLRYVGQVGYGLGRAIADRLAVLLESLCVDDSPFVDGVHGRLRWVEPHVVVDVDYREATAVGTLRQPVLAGLAPEAIASSVRLPAEFASPIGSRPQGLRVGAGQRL